MATDVKNALPHTIVLTLCALSLAFIVGVILGTAAAARPGGWVDSIIGVSSMSVITIPSYVAGLFLLLFFVVWLGWLPAVGAGEFSDPVDYARHLILPVLALAAAWSGILARLIRTSLLEVLGQNYILAARANGIPRRTIFFKYALKNALVPAVAILGVGLGHLLGGAIFVETIFARPGLGTVIVGAIQQRNFPVVRGSVFVVAVLFILANLCADLGYRVLNPRVRGAESPR